MAAPVSKSDSKYFVSYNLKYVWLITITAALGGLLFGYDWVVIGGAKPFFERYFRLTDPSQVGWANSCALIGCLVGAIVAGVLSDRFGRKPLLHCAALLFAVTSIGNALSTNSVFLFSGVCLVAPQLV
jgi:MFS family permease